ncbi:ankyrin repeat domain-containing protein [Labilibacter marinus]|uniref:ankyrin repeat domain-containing protein n=1 Tax=Labilibacter marinus TaxID=1477105 RepID=UPI000832B0EA|nr:ankyrin repeat domain-containing protein [Labilibacter marinus]
MNRLYYFAAILLITSIVSSCNTKSNKKEATDTVVADKTEIKAEKVFDIPFIMESALEGNIATIKGALDNGYNANSIDENKRTAIMLAAYNGHTSIVDLLIEKGADVNLVDNINRTALMYASTGDFVPTVLSLLEAGANPNMVDNEESWTAVMMAAAEGQLEVVKTLVAHGADLSMVDVDGESSLDFANSKGHKAVAEYIKAQTK